jgi:ribosomal protein S18 acetylase RimI-like enzyme
LSDVLYRKARAEDFPEIFGLLRNSVDNLLREHGFFDSSPFASPKQPTIPQTFPWFEMGLKEDSDGFWVATAENKIAGITLSWVRGSLWYLAHLFVSPEYQGLDIGRNLMEKAIRHHKTAPITNRALVTFAYNPVSISLYARHGMYPREPMYYMECPSNQVKTGPTNTKLKIERITDFEKNRTTLSRIDEHTLGYPREKNHEFLFSLPTVRCHLYSTAGEPVAYAYVWQNGRIGPLATTSPTILQEVLRSAFKLAASEGAANVAMLATGSNEKLMEVALEQKMRILDNWLLMSAKPFPNFSNYVIYPTGAML